MASYKSGYNALSNKLAQVLAVNSHTDDALLTKINQNLHGKKKLVSRTLSKKYKKGDCLLSSSWCVFRTRKFLFEFGISCHV